MPTIDDLMPELLITAFFILGAVKVTLVKRFSRVVFINHIYLDKLR